MTAKTARYLMIYGAFLITMGVLGYLSNPEKAKTALMSGGTFGGLSVLWGILGKRGIAWSWWAGMICTSFLTLVFAWRASMGWLAVSKGSSEKLTASCLITLMLVGSIIMLPCLLRGRVSKP